MAGGVLMTLLGLARGTGGLVLLTRGSAADPDMHATGSVVLVVGAFLLVLGLALVVSAAGVFRRLPSFWLTGIICTVAFVIDGAINGYVLYGQPGDRGTVVNVIAAALILTCLLAGKGALRGSTAQQVDAADRPSG